MDYPILRQIVKEWPGTVIDDTYEEILKEKPETLLELIELTQLTNYAKILKNYEGVTIEELLEDLTPTYFIDIPPTTGSDEWYNVRQSKDKAELLKWAKEKFGCDDNGMICILSQS